MVYKNFDDLISKVKGSPERKIMAVAAAGDAHTLDAVVRAQKEGIVNPLLIGDKQEITYLLKEMGETASEGDIYDCPDVEDAARLAVKLVKEGRADLIMKGKLQTSAILKAVVDKENGIGSGRTMSHFAIMEIPAYHKLLAVVDGGMIPYPTLLQKKDIINNTVDPLISMGYDCPKVGVLACIETVNTKMPETVEGYELKIMNQKGEIKNCIVEGPISVDCALDKKIADMKGFDSLVAGDADIVVVPNIHTGNIMGKVLTCFGNAKMAGFIVGAKCPVVLTSRGATSEEKYLSIVVSAAAAKERWN